MSISEVTRRDIIDYLIASETLSTGSLNDVEFLGRVWDLNSMPSTDSRFDNANGDVWQHRVNNNDWDDHYLLYSYLELHKCDTEIFTSFLENCLHPIVRPTKEHINKLLSVFNDCLQHDGYVLSLTLYISNLITDSPRQPLKRRGGD